MSFHSFPPTELDRLLAADPLAEAASRAVLAATRGQKAMLGSAPFKGKPTPSNIPWGKLETAAANVAAMFS